MLYISSFPLGSGISILQSNFLLFEMTRKVPTKGQAQRKDLTTPFRSCKARQEPGGGERGKGTGGRGGEQRLVLYPCTFALHALFHFSVASCLEAAGAGRKMIPSAGLNM